MGEHASGQPVATVKHATLTREALRSLHGVIRATRHAPQGNTGPGYSDRADPLVQVGTRDETKGVGSEDKPSGAPHVARGRTGREAEVHEAEQGETVLWPPYVATYRAYVVI